MNETFTVTCNKCGGSNEYKQDDSTDNKKISMYVREIAVDWEITEIESVSITCENKECTNDIELDY